MVGWAFVVDGNGIVRLNAHGLPTDEELKAILNSSY
jgi:hypothetical protein